MRCSARYPRHRANITSTTANIEQNRTSATAIKSVMAPLEMMMFGPQAPGEPCGPFPNPGVMGLRHHEESPRRAAMKQERDWVGTGKRVADGLGTSPYPIGSFPDPVDVLLVRHHGFLRFPHAHEVP